MNHDTFDCLALSLVPGLGTVRGVELVREYGSVGRVLGLSMAELKSLGLCEEARAFIASGWARKEAEDVLERARRQNIRVLSRTDEEYPHLLRQIFDPPLILYCRGNAEALRQPCIAIVGSRRCSPYGKEVTQKLAAELAGWGLCIVSGLARGIDSQAHLGSLASGGRTVAVLGNGVDVIYPRENRRLYEQICREGCVISEFPLGSFPAPQNFPIRNRIISGLCFGTLITEAAEFSGSLITARMTLEQDRELWAVPGYITRPGSYGPNYLIKQGAGVVLQAADVLENLPPYVLDRLRPPTSKAAAGELSDRESGVLKLLSPDASVEFDRLLRESVLGLPELNQILLQLQMKGLIRQWPGRRFSRRLTP